MNANALPAPRQKGHLTLEECLARRRSHRAFTARALSAAQISQLLWAAQGTTSPEGLRTAPSAGGCYPLELYVVRQEGVFRYRPRVHALAQIAEGDRRADLQRAALDQMCVGQAPCVFVLAAEMTRTARRYGMQRAPRYVWMEAGHAAQNLLLQATALGLGAVPLGAFDDEAVRRVVGLPELQAPLYLIPVGWVAPPPAFWPHPGGGRHDKGGSLQSPSRAAPGKPAAVKRVGCAFSRRRRRSGQGARDAVPRGFSRRRA